MAIATSNWTDTRVETVKTLWLDGLSAAEIARRMGGTTRNAVIGKVHRLGLKGRGTPAEPGRVRRAARPIEPRAKRQPKPVRAHVPAPPRGIFICEPAPVRMDAPGSETVLTIRGSQCRWPIGDPSSESFTLCGRNKERGAYCCEHGQLAYRGAPVLATSLLKYA